MVKLDARLAELGQRYADREAGQHEALVRARTCADSLHARIAAAIQNFHAAAGAEVPQLRLTLSEPRVDDKHLHSIQFELLRGRCRAIVTVKSRGEITLVGPFHAGKAEGPCRTFPIDAADALDDALEPFLVAFIEEALTP
jgi:hypothetical protein